MSKFDYSSLLNKVEKIQAQNANNADITEILNALVNGIKKQDSISVISAKFDSKISKYLLTHKFEAPHDIIRLQEQLKKYAEEYHGGISLTTSFSIFK